VTKIVMRPTNGRKGMANHVSGLSRADGADERGALARPVVAELEVDVDAEADEFVRLHL